MANHQDSEFTVNTGPSFMPLLRAGVLACVALPSLALANGAAPVPENAIIGGVDATAGEFSSIVALVSADDSGSASAWYRQFCGASIVGERWVMTAAHCMFDGNGDPTNAASIRVVEGSLTLQEDNLDEQVVTNIFIHPQYDNNSLNIMHDIALLEMANPLQGPQVELFAGDAESLTGTTGIIAGWGATVVTSDGGYQFDDTLQRAAVPVVSRDACNAPESYNGLIQEGQLCAGFEQGGVDSCVGDSGGPMYVVNGNSLQQIGVTSFGIGCAEPNFYGVYTSVSDYLDWVDTYRSAMGPVTTGPDDTSDRDDDDESDQTVVDAGGSAETDPVIDFGSGGSAGAFGPFGLLALFAVGVTTRRTRRA